VSGRTHTALQRTASSDSRERREHEHGDHRARRDARLLAAAALHRS
jgi:hypothetical protein